MLDTKLVETLAVARQTLAQIRGILVEVAVLVPLVCSLVRRLRSKFRPRNPRKSRSIATRAVKKRAAR